jgi:serine/threonine protein kinase
MEPGPERYRVLKLISRGGFGSVHSGEDVETHEEIAIKIESADAPNPQLPAEAAIYETLSGGIAVPRFHWCGRVGDEIWLVIDRLPTSLESLFQRCQFHFSLKTILMLADQMLSAVQFVHEKGIVHRDVKPENFMFGCGSKRKQLFLIDYGLAKRYRDPESKEHVQLCQHTEIHGTATYSSLNCLRGYECSRRDDLESIAYCLIYFIRGTLPWMHLEGETTEDKFRRVTEVKLEVSIAELCAGIPPPFASFFRAVRALGFAEDPQYALYRQWFRDLFLQRQFVFDGEYEWVQDTPEAALGSKRWKSSPLLVKRGQMGGEAGQKSMDDWVPRPQAGLRPLRRAPGPKPPGRLSGVPRK